MIGRMAKRRLLWWGAGMGCGWILPFFGFSFLLFMVIAAFFMVFGGLGYHSQKTPPPLPTQAVYSSQWLNLVQHVDTANRFFTSYPAVLWVASMEATSGGMPLDRTHSGGYGLFDLPRQSNMAHPLAATNAFALDLREHEVPRNLKATLNSVGQTIRPAQTDWSSTIRSDINALEQGPEIAAWPVVTNWSSTDWVYPKKTAIDVVATASAPVGNPYSLAWTPPYTVCTPPPPHSGQKPACHTVTDNITGRDIQGPVSMALETSGGRVVPMVPVEGPSNQYGFVYNHAVLYVTTQKVLVNAQHPATITARWSGGVSVSSTLPGNGFAVGSGGPVGQVPTAGNPKTLNQIWSSYRTIIQHASQTTGVPESSLVAEIYQESKGINHPYQPGAACGIFQMFTQSFTAFSPPGTPAYMCEVPSVETQAAAGYLRYLHNLFGSWREALAAYYGGQGTVESSGVHYGTPWAQAASLLNWVPFPQDGNVLPMTVYAEDSYDSAVSFAKAHHLPMP